MVTLTSHAIFSRFKQPFYLYSFMMLLGILAGLSHQFYLQAMGLFISDLFIRIFKFISLPIIILSIIVTISHYANDGTLQRLWKKTLFYTFSTTLIAASISCFLFLFIKPGNVDALQTAAPLATKQTYLDHITAIIPQNIISPFLEQQVMTVLFLGILIGIAIRFIPNKEAKKTIQLFFQGFHGIFFIITQWVVKILPLGVFGFMTATIVQLQHNINLTSLLQYLEVIVVANLIQGLVILPIWLWVKGIKPFDTMKKMSPALTLAFFSKSSAGTLPVTIQTAENALKMNPKIARFVLPICTTLNMNGCAAFIFTTVIFLMQNNGVDITVYTLGVWILIATIAAIGNAGVPMGCFFLSASLLTSMNIPIVLLGLILPFYTIIDMIETTLNVWSDSCVAKVVDKEEGEFEPDLVPANDD